MEPTYNEKQPVLPETISQKLAKRPLLLIILTASVSFGVQLIPFRTVLNCLQQILEGLLQASTYPFKLQGFFQPFLTPHLLLGFVCFAILFIWYTSQRDKGESKLEDQNNSFESHGGFLYRTATMGQSIFKLLIPQAEDEQILSSRDAVVSFDKDIPLGKQANTDDTVLFDANDSGSTMSEQKPLKSDPQIVSTSPLTRASGSNKKLSRPATSTGFPSKDLSELDPKLTSRPKSFREDPLQLDKEELRSRFETYLGNVRRQLQLQKQESLQAKLFNSQLKDLKQSAAPELKDMERNSGGNPELLSASLLFNDGCSLKDEKEKKLPRPEMNEYLTEAELNERIGFFLSSYEDGSKGEISETMTPPRHKWHSNSFSVAQSDSSALKTPQSDHLTHSSSQIVRGDSVAIDNQKFETFLQNFRNELRLQKQKSNLRHQLHPADDI